MKAVKLAYFSPTGTTRRVLDGIACGLGAITPEHIDITKPAARTTPLRTGKDDLLIIGIPVYMGRVPALLSEWLGALEADKTPTVCVVVYGNRAYEDALLELKDIVSGRGGIPIAGAAYIGEHSFSDSGTPIALGRPDAGDLEHARGFGQAIRAKLDAVPSVTALLELEVPGTFPYGGVTELWDVDFIDVDDTCQQCGLCAKSCPMGAINSTDSTVINKEQCITCCACIKQCPQNARSIKPGPVLDARERLGSLFCEPKMPEIFI